MVWRQFMFSTTKKKWRQKISSHTKEMLEYMKFMTMEDMERNRGSTKKIGALR